MKRQLFLLKLKNLANQRNLLLMVSAGLVFCLVILSALLIQKKETTILVPPQINQGFSFSANHPSNSYLEEMSLFFTGLVLDNSEASFPYKRDLILRYVAPEYFGILKRQLMDEQARYKRENLSTHFRPLEVVVKLADLEVLVAGELVSFVGSTKASQAKETFSIKYSYNGGFLSIVSFQKMGESL